MKRIAAAALALLLPLLSHATSFDFFGGLGMSAGQMDLEKSKVDGRFQSLSYYLTAGAIYSFNPEFGLVAIADKGITHANNNVNSDNHIENAHNDYFALKAGFMVNRLSFGAGTRDNNLKIKSLSTTEGATVEKYDGNLSSYFISYNLESDRAKGNRFLTSATIEQIRGKLGELTYEETLLSLRLVILFDPK